MTRDITSLMDRVRRWMIPPAPSREKSPGVGPDLRPIRVEIPDPETKMGARVTDAATGKALACRSLDIHVDAETMQPILTLELMDLEASVVGTWECRKIKERPL